MRKLAVVVIMCAASLFFAACSKDGGKGASEKSGQQGKAADPGAKGFVDVIKKNKLGGYSNSTIGDALDTYRFFDKREWSESRSTDGKIYVGFWGWLNKGTLDASSAKEGIAARGVEAKFVIYQDGTYALIMLSKIEAMADGKKFAYPLGDKKRIMDAIYSNKEITF